MYKIFLTITLLILSPIYIYAQVDTSLNDLRAEDYEVKAAEIEELDKLEEERTQEIANQLGFVLPEYTDNPSYVITFTDPSASKKGVEIELDGKAYTTITSPYTFPALGIGKHDIKFRFYDQSDNAQTLEYEFIVLPRSPIISTPVFTDTTITVSGTALSDSEVIYTLTANAYSDSNIILTDENGNWSITVTPEGGLSDGIYSFSAYTRKYGYASNLSTPVVFGVGEDSNLLNPTVEKEIYFSFKGLNKENILNIFKDNSDLSILTAGSLVLGILLAVILKSLIDGKKGSQKIKQVEEILTKKQQSDAPKEEKTLREMFEPEKEEKKEEKHERIVNRDVFLRTYKNLDPDEKGGKEKSSKEIKKKIKVSLTTKEE